MLFAERGYTTDWLKQTFLLGVDLTLDDGTDYPQEIFDTAVKQAERAVQDELGLIFNPQEFRERHDKEPDQAEGWYPLRTRYRPLINVDKINIVYGNSSTRAELPPQWAMITEPIAGQVHIVPTTEGASSYIMAGGMPVILGLGGLSAQYYIPAYFEIQYKAGFPVYTGSITIPTGDTKATITLSNEFKDLYEVELTAPTGIVATSKNKSFNSFDIEIIQQTSPTTITWMIDTLPSDIARAVALKASLLILDVAGDLIVGAGIASISTSMDGLSQNINTTASATNSGYGSRVLQFTKEYKELISTLKATYRALNIMAL